MKMKLLLFLIAAPLLFTGCASQKTWVYRANSYSLASSKTEKKVAILPFEDSRENKNENLWGISFIPLVPYGPMNFNSPEGVSQHATSGLWMNFKPTEDFPKALAEDLRNTGLFSDAFFDFRRESGDFAVKGKIISTKYDGRIITYGLSFYGAYLWLVGFPCAWTQNELSLEIGLVDSKTDKLLFLKTYTATPRKSASCIYSLNSDFNYAEMLAELNKQFCMDIQPIVLNPVPLTPEELKAAELKASSISEPSPKTKPKPLGPKSGR
jgi:hypothetical protein